MTAVARVGPATWVRGYAAMLRWEATGLRRLFVPQFAVQVLLGAGVAVGVGLLHDPSGAEAMFLASGAAVVAVVVHGLATAPRPIAAQRAAGAYEFVQSLPVPRGAGAAASLTTAVLAGLPGMAVAVAITAWRYDVAVTVGWAAVAAVGLSAVTAAVAGYALARTLDNALLGLIGQVLVFILLGFAPVNFPPERLPQWLDRLHDWLPFEPMAVVTRAAFTPELTGGVARAYLTLLAWLVGLLVVTAAVLARRR